MKEEGMEHSLVLMSCQPRRLYKDKRRRRHPEKDECQEKGSQSYGRPVWGWGKITESFPFSHLEVKVMGVKAEAAVDTGAGVTILDTQLSKMRTYLGFFYYINQVWK